MKSFNISTLKFISPAIFLFFITLPQSTFAQNSAPTNVPIDTTNYEYSVEDYSSQKKFVAPVPDKNLVIPQKLSHNLKLGDNDPEVVLLKNTLRRLGYLELSQTPGVRESYLDEKTESALISYQKKYSESGVEPTGIVDNVTIVFLNKDIKSSVDELNTSSQKNIDGNNKVSIISTISKKVYSVVNRTGNIIVDLFGKLLDTLHL